MVKRYGFCACSNKERHAWGCTDNACAELCAWNMCKACCEHVHMPTSSTHVAPGTTSAAVASTDWSSYTPRRLWDLQITRPPAEAYINTEGGQIIPYGPAITPCAA